MNKVSNVANIVSLLRVALLFILVFFIYGQTLFYKSLALVLVVIVILMDAYDGYLARKYECETKLGGVLDITGDRIIENVMWIVFAHLQLVSIWIPIIVISRGFMTDSVRSIALSRGMTAFGKDSMMKSSVGRFLVSSRLVRAGYGFLKGLTFTSLILLFILESYAGGAGLSARAQLIHYLNPLTAILVYATVSICLLRGVPVLIESRRLFSSGKKSVAHVH